MVGEWESDPKNHVTCSLFFARESRYVIFESNEMPLMDGWLSDLYCLFWWAAARKGYFRIDNSFLPREARNESRDLLGCETCALSTSEQWLPQHHSLASCSLNCSVFPKQFVKWWLCLAFRGGKQNPRGAWIPLNRSEVAQSQTKHRTTITRGTRLLLKAVWVFSRCCSSLS